MTKKEKSVELKLLNALHGQLGSAYATCLFGVKDYEKKLSGLSTGATVGPNGVMLADKQARLTRVSALINAATEELEDLICIDE